MIKNNPLPQYPSAPAELIEDLRKRFAELPAQLRAYVDHGLRCNSIEHVAALLWKTGYSFASSELYEYRRTLFPPGAMVDPYTAGPPELRPQFSNGGGEPKGPDAPPKPLDVTDETDDSARLAETRERLVRILHHRAGALTIETPPVVSVVQAQASTTGHPGLLLADLRDVINRYVVLPEMAAEALALWIVHTYAFTLRQVTTYIGVVSPEKRCGKTTLLELLGSFAREAVAAANISPSALFRVIEEDQPTLIIDEADTFLQGRDEMAGILNAGYRKGNSYVVRVADGKLRKPGAGGRKAGSQLVKYSCWCPKVMAAIGRLPETLADRCIVITMQRKMPGEKCERLRDLDATPYRRRCADFVEHHRDALATARPEIPSALNDRAADIWEPLLAIADLAPGDWPQLARQAALALSASSDEEMTLLAYFIHDIRNYMVAARVDRILSRELVEACNEVHDRPWEDLRTRREINEWWISRQMRQLGIRPKYLRTGKSVARGYTLSDIEAAFRRYVPNPEVP